MALLRRPLPSLSGWDTRLQDPSGASGVGTPCTGQTDILSRTSASGRVRTHPTTWLEVLAVLREKPLPQPPSPPELLLGAHTAWVSGAYSRTHILLGPQESLAAFSRSRHCHRREGQNPDIYSGGTDPPGVSHRRRRRRKSYCWEGPPREEARAQTQTALLQNSFKQGLARLATAAHRVAPGPQRPP